MSSSGRTRCSACTHRMPLTSRVAGGSAALADVVPEARRALLRDAARQDAVRGLVHPRHPRLVTGDLRELIEQARRPGRSVAPAQVIEVEAVRLIVLDEADVAFGLRDGLQVL